MNSTNIAGFLAEDNNFLRNCLRNYLLLFVNQLKQKNPLRSCEFDYGDKEYRERIFLAPCSLILDPLPFSELTSSPAVYR